MTWQKEDVRFSQLFLWKSRQTSSSQKWGGVHGSSFIAGSAAPQQLKHWEWRPQRGGWMVASKMGVLIRILNSKMFNLLLLVFGSVNASQPRCGYDSCPKPKVSGQQTFRYKWIVLIFFQDNVHLLATGGDAECTFCASHTQRRWLVEDCRPVLLWK